MSTQWFVNFPPRFVVVDRNDENAEIDNPRGERVGERYFVQAEDAQGHRRVWGGLYETPDVAEVVYALLAPSVDFWEEIAPAYGSEAYARNWRKYQAADLEAEADADKHMEAVYGPLF